MPAAGMEDVAGPEQWFRALPFMTRYWFGGAVGLTLAGNFGVISPMQFLFNWQRISSNIEVWRLLSCFFYAGPFSFPTLIAIYMLVQFSKQYEAGGPYNTGAGGGTADYAFMLIFGMTVIMITYPLVNSFLRIPPLFTRNLIFYVLYVWSKRNPTGRSSIWGVPVTAVYLPFAYLALTVFMGNPFMDMLHGLMVGHLYYFLVDVVPQVQGRDILRTPQFLIDQFGVGEYRPEAAPVPPHMRPGFNAGQRPGAADAGGAGGAGGAHHWGGGGQPLGRQ